MEALFVLDTVQDLFRTSQCASMHHYWQATANNNTPAKVCNSDFHWSVRRIGGCSTQTKVLIMYREADSFSACLV